MPQSLGTYQQWNPVFRPPSLAGRVRSVSCPHYHTNIAISMPVKAKNPAFVKPDFHDIPVDNLIFDWENPRLTMGEDIKNDRNMVQVLWNNMAVDEIVDSISANGFFREEPLVAVPRAPNKTDSLKDKFIVV